MLEGIGVGQIFCKTNALHQGAGVIRIFIKWELVLPNAGGCLVLPNAGGCLVLPNAGGCEGGLWILFCCVGEGRNSCVCSL